MEEEKRENEEENKEKEKTESSTEKKEGQEEGQEAQSFQPVTTPVSERKEKKSGIGAINYVLLIIVAAVMVFNQVQIAQISGGSGTTGLILGGTTLQAEGSGKIDFSNVDLDQITSTAQTVKVLFPVDDVKTTQDAIDIIVPTGTPEYGEELGVSYDDPVNSLNFMARKLWPQMKQLKTSNTEVWNRYVNLASKPVGISCEYCCGLKAVGIRADGESMCGCQHNPALLALTLWLMENRPDMSDAEILHEVIKWKALFFPKKMVELTMEVAGKDLESLAELPGMVGGC